jgi:hypothetical protein
MSGMGHWQSESRISYRSDMVVRDIEGQSAGEARGWRLSFG